MKELFLDLAGRRPLDDPIHRRLTFLQPGSALFIRARGETLWLCDEDGEPVAGLSRTARAEWWNRLDEIWSIRVLAMVQRRREDCARDFGKLCRSERWEVPIVEVVY